MKIEGRICDKSLPVVCQELGRLFDYMTDVGWEAKLAWYRLIAIYEHGKRHEFLYSIVNMRYQVRCKWDEKRRVFRVCGYSTERKKTFGHVQCYTIDDADYAIRELEKEIANRCIMQNDLLSPFTELWNAVILQSFDDFRLASNRVHDCKAKLKKHEIDPFLSETEAYKAEREYRESLDKLKCIMDEVRQINPKYAMKLKMLSGKKYRGAEDMVRKIGGI